MFVVDARRLSTLPGFRRDAGRGEGDGDPAFASGGAAEVEVPARIFLPGTYWQAQGQDFSMSFKAPEELVFGFGDVVRLGSLSSAVPSKPAVVRTEPR